MGALLVPVTIPQIIIKPTAHFLPFTIERERGRAFRPTMNGHPIGLSVFVSEDTSCRKSVRVSDMTAATSHEFVRQRRPGCVIVLLNRVVPSPATWQPLSACPVIHFIVILPDGDGTSYALNGESEQLLVAATSSRTNARFLARALSYILWMYHPFFTPHTTPGYLFNLSTRFVFDPIATVWEVEIDAWSPEGSPCDKARILSVIGEWAAMSCYPAGRVQVSWWLPVVIVHDAKGDCGSGLAGFMATCPMRTSDRRMCDILRDVGRVADAVDLVLHLWVIGCECLQAVDAPIATILAEICESSCAKLVIVSLDPGQASLPLVEAVVSDARARRSAGDRPDIRLALSHVPRRDPHTNAEISPPIQRHQCPRCYVGPCAVPLLEGWVGVCGCDGPGTRVDVSRRHVY